VLDVRRSPGFPEQFEVGLKAHAVTEKYYFARGPQLVNRVVDIGPVLQQKVASIRSCKNMIDNMVRGVNDQLAERGYRLPAYTGSPDTANDAFIQNTFVARDKAVGASMGWNMRRSFTTSGRTLG